jgi:hypothetical protein
MNLSNSRHIWSLAFLSCLGLAGSACQGTAVAEGPLTPPAQGNATIPTIPDTQATPPALPEPDETPDTTDTLTITLHPNHSSVINADTIASFGVPFPRGAVASVNQLVVRNAAGQELPSHVQPLVTWRTLGATRPSDGSVRSALIYVSVRFTQDAPMQIRLQLNGTRTLQLGTQPAATTNWRTITRSDFNIALKEPPIYATLPPAWLSSCELRTMTTVANSDPDWAWFDTSYVNSAYTATNDLPASITQRINMNENEPWLFDRTMTLFNVYTRTGDVRWLRHAHRSARFYLAHLNSTGYFDYKAGDLKYVYGHSFLVDLMLTGDTSLLTNIEKTATLQKTWNPVYTQSTSFWTERHQTYALLGALTAWEATGAATHRDRVMAIVNASFAHANDPPGTWAAEGCMLHKASAHEGVPNQSQICSPWMNALFASAMWNYYLQSLDQNALEFLADLGDFIAEEGLYDGGAEDVDFLVPYYLASSVYHYTDSGAWGDLEHTCDVANVVARGAWARAELGRDPAALIDTTLELLAGCEYNLNYWHRPNGVVNGLPEWRLSPARKFNWWFGTTADMPWILDQLGVSP